MLRFSLRKYHLSFPPSFTPPPKSLSSIFFFSLQVDPSQAHPIASMEFWGWSKLKTTPNLLPLFSAPKTRKRKRWMTQSLRSQTKRKRSALQGKKKEPNFIHPKFIYKLIYACDFTNVPLQLKTCTSLVEENHPNPDRRPL